ncbi:RHS repeat-associated core domain-containing protein [Escherichia albertii]|uniref:RHS repeat-associated core domain-containing protein n=1 Tax=Escherichia albertii TaxID=208962 RepID=UPI0007443E33|nr:RHS repeat-associated core domain-containing protein [Escherichia albertii]
MGDNFAARQGDDIIHTSVLGDVATLVFEGVVFAATGAIVAGTAIMAAPLLTAAGATGAAAAAVAVGESCFFSGMIAGFMTGALGLADDISKGCSELANALFPPSPAGTISTGSTNVLTNDIPAARAAGQLVADTGKAGLTEKPEEEEHSFRDYASMLLNSGTAFFSQLWDPTVDGPSGQVKPSGVDKVDCKKHDPVQYLAEGSSSVSVNDLPAVRAQDRTTCGATVSTDVSPNVVIGGESVVVRPIKSGKLPGLEIMYMAASLLMGKSQKMLKALPCMLAMAGGGMIASRMGEASRATFFPVHAATGAKVLSGEEDIDFTLPARFPLVWQRIYNSRNPHEGMFGHGWRTEFETFVTTENELCCFHDVGGRELRFDTPAPGIQQYYADEGLIIARGDQGQMMIADADGSVWRLYLPLSPDGKYLRLASLSDEYGNGLMLSYDEHQRLCAIHDTEGVLTVCLQYDDPRYPVRVTRITEPGDEKRATLLLAQYLLDDAGNLAGVQDAAGRMRRRFEWTAEHLMAAHRLPEGLRSEYRWKKFDDWRVVEQRTSAGGHNILHYDLEARLTTVTDELGHTRQHAWNDAFLPIRFTDEAGNDWHYVWNALGLLTEYRDPECQRWQYRYDEAGNLTEEEDALGRITLTSWMQSRTLPVSSVLPGGGIYHYGYDACHGLVEQISPGARRQRFERDEYGQVVSVADDDGILQRFGYNRHGQMTVSTDCSGNNTVYHYNDRHWLTTVVDAQGERWHREYDDAGELREVSGPDDWYERIGRDAQGRVVRHRTADGQDTHYEYDDTGWLVRRRDPRGGEVVRRRDSRLRLTGLYNENGESWRFIYGPNNRLEAEQGFDGALTRYTYDRCDRAVSRTFLADTVSSLTWLAGYDAVGQMVGLSTPDITRRYEYTADGELCSAEEIHADGTRSRVSLVFDEEGRVVAEEGIRGTVGYEYDRRDNRTVTQLPDGRKLRSHYYGSGHLLQMALDERVLTEFSRDALHRETRRTQGQVFTQRRYDRLGRPCWRGIYHESSPLRAERECWQEYDLRYNLVREREVVKSPWPWKEYGYEAGDYLQEYRTCTGIREQFSYDAAGNIREHASSGPCRHNRLEAFRGHGYRYDVYGRMVERELPGGEIQKLEYDTFHRLVKVTCTPADWNMLIRYVNYDYDALNRRVRKWVKYERHAGSFSGRERETETWFLWEGMRLLGEEENGRPVVYVYEGPGSYVPLARIDGGREKATIRWYHCGVNGAPDRVTNEEGKTEWRHDTGGWGRTESEYEYGMIRENLRYQGQYLDRETGLHYNLHRYFAPECGRFIQPDPIGLNGGLNLYAYGPNPLSWIDPLGLAVDPIAKLEDRGYTGVTRTSGGGLDYSNSNALYNKRPGVSPKVTIEYSGDYEVDYQRANARAGLNQVSTPRGYVWHHLDDYDPVTNTGTMQLIEKQAHSGISHNGGVSQYKAATGKEYTHPARNRGSRKCG